MSLLKEMAELKKKKRKVATETEGHVVEEKKEKTKKKKVTDVVEEPKKKVKKVSKEENALEEFIPVNSSPSEESSSNVTEKKKRKRKDSKKKKHGRLEDIAEPRVETIFFDEAPVKNFADFELDERILKGIGELGWERPTEVQLSMIDLALEGKNVMARARTGSGKTAAFVLPILHRVVQVVSSDESCSSTGPLAVFIAPTKELTSQAYNLLVALLKPLPFVSVLNLAELAENEKSVWDNDQPEMVVATPGKLATILRSRPDFLSGVRHVVLDEADLLLSFGYEEEMKFIRRSLPSTYQCVLTSATLTDDMTTLKKMFITGAAVTIKLKEGDLPDQSQLSQYLIQCNTDEHRYSILLSLIKLKLIVGKTIIFVNSVDRCYRLSIFLQAFAIQSCILNASMPANSRCYVINQFNRGEFSIVVASDASDVLGDEVEGEKKEKRKNRRMDKEAGVARGIDFHQVSNVVNFDFPLTLDSYIHRVGRTARGFNKGTALSFCTPPENESMEHVRQEMIKQMGSDVMSPYEMRIKELDSFVLRAREALAACTKLVVKEARLDEIRQEALRSAKLQAFFAKNPREKHLLEKDKKLHSLKMYTHAIADVPDYIVPKALRGMDYSIEKRKGKMGQRARNKHKTFNEKKFQKKQADPLQSFSI